MSKLTTHILDTARGRPASGVQIKLYRIENSETKCLVSEISNLDGRTDLPLLTGENFRVGSYELTFSMGAYFSSVGYELDEPLFIDLVPIHFSIASPELHYHVPLLVSPWSYSTYRGS